VSAAQIQRAVAHCAPVWDLLRVPERSRILHLLLESAVYNGATGELKLAGWPRIVGVSRRAGLALARE
jgi:hypothetical protein